VRAAEPVLHRAPNRWANLQQFDVRIGAWKSLPQVAFELVLEPVTDRHAALGDDDHLTKPAIGSLQIERENEPRRAGSHIGRPMIDPIISVQLLTLRCYVGRS